MIFCILKIILGSMLIIKRRTKDKNNGGKLVGLKNKTRAVTFSIGGRGPRTKAITQQCSAPREGLPGCLALSLMA